MLLVKKVRTLFDGKEIFKDQRMQVKVSEIASEYLWYSKLVRHVPPKLLTIQRTKFRVVRRVRCDLWGPGQLKWSGIDFHLRRTFGSYSTTDGSKLDLRYCGIHPRSFSILGGDGGGAPLRPKEKHSSSTRTQRHPFLIPPRWFWRLSGWVVNEDLRCQDLTDTMLDRIFKSACCGLHRMSTSTATCCAG